jgi:hypothetical protein
MAFIREDDQAGWHSKPANTTISTNFEALIKKKVADCNKA